MPVYKDTVFLQSFCPTISISSLLKKKKSPKPNKILEDRRNIFLKIRMQVSSCAWGLCEIFTSLQLKTGPEEEPVFVLEL